MTKQSKSKNKATKLRQVSNAQKVHFYNGNIKVGDMLTFNKLAGNVELNGCKGSCSNYCKYCWSTENWKKSPCYVAKSYVQYKDNIINSHIVNTLAMRENPWAAANELNSQLQRKRTNKTVRIHSSGELESVQELKAWIWIASQNPNRKFYIYTKAYDIVSRVLSKNQLPPNFYINISIWHDQGLKCYEKWKHLDNVRAFVYNDNTWGYNFNKSEICKCPAYDDKGKLHHDLTCDKCKICFQNKNKICICNSH